MNSASNLRQLRTVLFCTGLMATPALADADYGEQIAIADGASVGLSLAAIKLAGESNTGSKVAAGIALGSYVLFSPAVHLLGHGEADRAAASFAMRVVPAVSLLSLSHCDSSGDAPSGCLLAHLGIGLIGALTATAVDIFVVADGSSPRPTPRVLHLISGQF